MTAITPDIEVDALFDPEARIARDVLRDVLGDFFSQEDEDFHATAWEQTNAIPLKRSWESWADYVARKKEFKGVPKSYFMDAQSGQQSLARLRSKDVLTVGDVNEMHALEDMLGTKRTDIEAIYKPKDVKIKTNDGDKVEKYWHRKVTKAEEDTSALDAFQKIESAPVWVDRVRLVQSERDHGALQLVILRDTREEVREAAQQRVMELEIAGK